ncbi:hypothetical protein GCM10023191_005480 [Actinoallomurus oryzae]|uniref:Uncharacterized protein n=1 Tax=Actinoallomurus oryzae TaxID=502180 RepID=A0ABP8P8A4_9ACTN
MTFEFAYNGSILQQLEKRFPIRDRWMPHVQEGKCTTMILAAMAKLPAVCIKYFLSNAFRVYSNGFGCGCFWQLSHVIERCQSTCRSVAGLTDELIPNR